MFNVPVEPVRALNPSQLCKRTAHLRDGYIGQDPRRSRTVRGVAALTRITEKTRAVEQRMGARQASCNQAVKDIAGAMPRHRPNHLTQSHTNQTLDSHGIRGHEVRTHRAISVSILHFFQGRLVFVHVGSQRQLKIFIVR